MTTKKKRSVHTDKDSWVVIAPGTLHLQVYCVACYTRVLAETLYTVFSAHLILLRLCNYDKCLSMHY